MVDFVPQEGSGIGDAEVSVDIAKAFAVVRYSEFIEALDRAPAGKFRERSVQEPCQVLCAPPPHSLRSAVEYG